jgi:hypothetical protein
MMKRILATAIGLLTLTSCNEALTVHMDYISHEHLASSYVRTPDPLLETCLAGQRLVISWWVPYAHKDCRQFEIVLKLRYGNREEASASFSFEGRQGWYIYSLTNEEFFEKNGIKTYYVELYAAGQLIDEWRHQLWVELIDFPAEEAGIDDFELEEDEDDEIETRPD